MVGPAAARSQRWARYESVYLHFFDFPELDVREHALQLRFEGVDDAIDALAAPAGPIGAEERVRQALSRLLAAQHQPQDGGLLIEAAHAMVFARRPSPVARRLGGARGGRCAIDGGARDVWCVGDDGVDAERE